MYDAPNNYANKLNLYRVTLKKSFIKINVVLLYIVSYTYINTKLANRLAMAITSNAQLHYTKRLNKTCTERTGCSP